MLTLRSCTSALTGSLFALTIPVQYSSRVKGARRAIVAGKRALRSLESILIALIISVCQAHERTDLNDVHVVPRVQSGDAIGSLSTNAGGILRATVEMVMVPVTVMDGSHRIVSGLGQENFRWFEDKRPQSIKHV